LICLIPATRARCDLLATAMGARMVRRIFGILAAVVLTASIADAAENPFVGEWKMDTSASRLPDAMKVQSKGGNTYVFDFAGTPETIVVDGSDQAGTGGTLLSVKPEAPDIWIVERKKGSQLLLRATWKLSNGDRTLTDQFRGFAPGVLNVDYVYQRGGGGSGFAADWTSIKETMIVPFVLVVKPFEGDGLSIANLSTHITKNMKFDGKDYPDEGTPTGASASLRRVDDRTLVITDKFNGTVTVTENVGLSADLKTLTMTQHITGHDKPNVLVFRRT
jgi:hypothetical protein